MTTSEQWEPGFQDTIQCPHCGEHDHEYTDYPRLEHDGDRTDTECSYCLKPFRVTLCVTYEWATEPTPSRDARKGE